MRIFRSKSRLLSPRFSRFFSSFDCFGGGSSLHDAGELGEQAGSLNACRHLAVDSTNYKLLIVIEPLKDVGDVINRFEAAAKAELYYRVRSVLLR